MALSTATISYDISDLVGADFDSRRTKVWVTTNVEGDTIIDTVGNAIRVGDGLGSVAEDGTGSVAVWIPGTGSNPDSWQTTVHLDYAPRRPGAARVQRSFGPFTVSSSANLADLVEEQEVPPNYITTVTGLLNGYVDDAAASAAAAAASAAAADAYIIDDLGTSDGQVEALINSPSSLTMAALSGTYAPLHTKQSINACLDFGAVGDGITDDTAAIQAAIDAGLTERRAVYLPSLEYKITNTLRLGTAEGFNSIELYGDGAGAFRGEGGFGGPILTTTMTDRPLINFQRGRRSRIRGIALIGPLSTWVEAQRLASTPPAIGGAEPLIDDLLHTSWNDPSAAATADSRYAPASAITIDAFSGAIPASSYPAGAGTYGTAGGSQRTQIIDCYIGGFNTAIVSQPSDYDGNGDYHIIHNVDIEWCKYGISIGNSQCRNPDIRNVNMYKVFTAFTNRTHGKRIGRFGGNIDNIGMSNVIHIFDLDTATASPTTIAHMNIELVYDMGYLSASGGTEGCITIQSSVLNFDLHSPKRGVPGWAINTAGDQALTVILRACDVVGFSSVFASRSSYVQALDGTSFSPDDLRAATTVPTSPVRRSALNVLGGGWVCAGGAFRRTQSVRTRAANIDTGVMLSQVAEAESYTSTGRTYCIPHFMQQAQPRLQSRARINMPILGVNGVLDKSADTFSLTNRTLTITFSARSESLFHLYGPLPGDVLVDTSTGSVFFVTARTALVVTAILQSNYRTLDGGTTYTTLAPFVNDAGTVAVINSRFYTPSYVTYATGVDGNTVMTNVGRDDFYGAYINTDIAVGDHVWVDETIDRFTFISADHTKITARDGGAQTITLSSALQKSGVRQVAVLVRQPVANE